MSEYQKIPELFDYNQPRIEEYHTPKYSNRDKALIAAFEVLNAADWAQTRQIARDHKTGGKSYYEQNFPGGSAEIIGKHPNTNRVNAFMGAQAIGYPLIVNSLSEPYRTLFQILAVSSKAAVVNRNRQIGLDIVRW